MSYPILVFVDTHGTPLPLLDTSSQTQRVRQFRGGIRIRLDGNWSGGVALLGTNGTPLQLNREAGTANTSYWILPKSEEVRKQLEPYVKATAGASGVITATLVDSENHIIAGAPRQDVAILPANISVHQLQQMLQDIGLMALSSFSRSLQGLVAPSGEGLGVLDAGFPWFPGRGLLVTAASLLRLGKTIDAQRSRLERAPLRNLSHAMQPVRLPSRHPTPRQMAESFAMPEKRAALSPVLADSHDCVENQYVAYVVSRYLIELAPGISRRLETIDADFDSLDRKDIQIYPKTNRNAMERLLSNAETARLTSKTQQSEVREASVRLAADLDLLARRASQWLTHQPFTGLSLQFQIPQPTLRLIGTPGYAEIYSATSALAGGHLPKLERVLRVFSAIVQGQVRPTWEIYELWCAAQIYEALGTRIRDISARPGEDLFENLEVKNGELRIPRNRAFTLSSKTKSGPEFTFWYNPELVTYESDQRTPDMLIRVRRSASGENAAPYYFAFDAKYKGYSNGGDHVFFGDVEETAHKRYLDGIAGFRRGDKFQLVSSFILHSDRDTRTDYWGEQPISQFCRGVFPKLKLTSDSEYVGHKYGAIQLLPEGARRQTRRILALMLQYHIGGAFASICLDCGREANVVDNSTQKTVGKVFACPECGRMWVTSHCLKAGHPIVKLANDSFHLRTPGTATGWLFICPECGDDGKKTY